MKRHIPEKHKLKKGTFQMKLGISVAIIVSALVLKTFMGGPEGEAAKTIDRVVNGGLDYKEAVSAIGRAANGEEDVIEVFRNFAMPAEESSETESEKTDEEKQSDPAAPVIDSDFYQSKDNTTETNAQESNEKAEDTAVSDTSEDEAEPVATFDVQAIQEQQELAEAVALSFEMSPEELADDTKAEPFVIPPPSYCSYEQVSISFQHTTPVYGTITSKFGYRDHPIGGKASFHTGLDIAAKTGTAVSCFADGTVLEAGYNDTYGNYVLVEHSGGIRSFYGHNSKLVVKKRR